MNVLYVVYWGAGEPLGQSLVLPAVKKLAGAGVDLTLVTFDKAADLGDVPRMDAISEELAQRCVKWISLRYHKRPRVPATAWDVLQGSVRGIISTLRRRPHVVHGRTFVGAIIGRSIARAIGAPFVYHAEGFYPDEQVDGGFWAAGSLLHRATRAIDSGLFESADGIIVLTNRARHIVEALPRVRKRSTPVVVVPSCVDLDVFRPEPKERPVAGGPLRLVYTGGVGGRYQLDRAARFAAVIGRERPVTLRVLTRTDVQEVRSILVGSGLAAGSWSTDSVPYAAVPRELSRQDAGLVFIKNGLSEHGGSPTKVGEYWACGLPVVGSANVGDLEGIIAREQVGVVVRGIEDADYHHAWRELEPLLADPDLAARCRRAAENHYGLAPACLRQLEMYARFRGNSP